MEHHKEHYHWNQKLNQFCHGLSRNIEENHYPVWTGSGSWMPLHHSLHIGITGYGVTVHVAAFRSVSYNLANFDCLSWRDGVSYIYDIFHNKYKRLHHATWKFSYSYIETKYHLFCIVKKTIRLLLNKGVHMAHSTIFDWYRISCQGSICNRLFSCTA